MKKDINWFLQQSKLIFGDKYCYQKYQYLGTHTKSFIVCSVHGEFGKSPNAHIIKKQGCPECAKNNLHHNKSSIESFILNANKIHNNKYDYSKFIYISRKHISTIICPIHGEFNQQAGNHLLGHGCPKCGLELLSAKNKKLAFDNFVNKSQKIHGYKYNYSKSICKSYHNKVIITCLKHGDFEQRAGDHYSNGYGCPKCTSYTSKQELFIKEILVNYNINFEEKCRSVIAPLELDFYLPDYNLAIEVNGLRWHSELYKENNYHYNKYIQCERKQIRLIQLYEDEIKLKPNLVKEYILSQLRLNKPIYARNCEIKEINNEECSAFLNKFHFFGKCAAIIKLGLYHNNELVGVMLFSSIVSKRGVINKANEFELVRACFSKMVIGSSAKLFKYFIKHYSPTKITTYSDNDKFTGNSYQKLGFVLDANLKPDYKTLWNNFTVRRSKQYSKKSNLKKIFPDCDLTKTEHQICLENKVYRIYDTGKKKWLWVANK